MSNHIWSFLNIKHCITKAGHKLDNILVINAILHSLSCSNIWDIVKHDLLDKGKSLTLNILTMINKMLCTNIENLLSPWICIALGLFWGLSEHNEECF